MENQNLVVTDAKLAKRKRASLITVIITGSLLLGALIALIISLCTIDNFITACKEAYASSGSSSGSEVEGDPISGIFYLFVMFIPLMIEVITRIMVSVMANVVLLLPGFVCFLFAFVAFVFSIVCIVLRKKSKQKAWPGVLYLLGSLLLTLGQCAIFIYALQMIGR